jgi:flagellar biosynthesis/type III secretory pathway protein FliH
MRSFIDIEPTAGCTPVMPAADVAMLWTRDARRGPSGEQARNLCWPELAELARSPMTPRAAPAAEPALLFSEAELARLCAAAAAEAAAEATARLRDDQARDSAALQARLASSLTGLAATLAARRAELEAEAVAIGAELGRAIAHDALRQNPTTVAMGILGDLLVELRAEPEVTIEVPAEDEAMVQAELTGIADACGCAGAIEVRPSTILRRGEVRVLWRDGWAERLLDAVTARGTAGAVARGGPRPGQDVIDRIEIAEMGA